MLRALYNFSIRHYKDADDNRIFSDNPVKELTVSKKWNPARRKSNIISPTQLKEWFETINKVREDESSNNFTKGVCDFLIMAVLTGLRKGELLRLKWEEINFKEKIFIIGVNEFFTPQPGKEADTKNGDYIKLPISNYLCNLLEKRKKLLKSNEEYVFNADNDYGYIREPKKIIEQINDLSGITFSSHDLRRTFISQGELLGLGRYTLKRLLNHKISKNDVTDGYIILTADQLRVPSQKIEDTILKLADIKVENEPTKEKESNENKSTQDKLLEMMGNLTAQQQLKIVLDITENRI